MSLGNNMKGLELESSVFQKGFIAYFEGGSNPYLDEDAKEWLRGWNAGKAKEDELIEESMMAFYEALQNEPVDFDRPKSLNALY